MKKFTSILTIVVIGYIMVMCTAWAFDADHAWRVERGFNNPCSFSCVCNGEVELKSLTDFILLR